MDRLRVDVDGDGRADVAYQRTTQQPFDVRIGVCTAWGLRSEVSPGGMGEIFAATDVEPDGRAELLGGGTSVNAAYTTPIVFRAGRLHLVRFEGDELTLVADGFPSQQARHGWGCEDVTGDKKREIVQVTADYQRGTLIRAAYRIDGARARMVARSTATIPKRWRDPRTTRTDEFADAC